MKNVAGSITSLVQPFEASGTVRLDDGEELLFQRYVCSGFSPRPGMAVIVSVDRSTGTARVSSLQLATVPSRAGRRAPGEAHAERILAARERREAEREQYEQALGLVTAHVARVVRKRAAPKTPTFQRSFAQRVPPELSRFLATVRTTISHLRPTLEHPSDPAFVLFAACGVWSIGVQSHPELPLALAYGQREIVGTRLLATPGPVARLLKDQVVLERRYEDMPDALLDERDETLRAVFSSGSAKRSDAALVRKWLDSRGAGHARAGATLLRLYEARGWSTLASRLRAQLEHLAHDDLVQTTAQTFVKQLRARRTFPRAVIGQLAAERF